MQTIKLFHRSVVCFLLGLAALPGNAIDEAGKHAEQLVSDNEQAPGEEFWLFMVEFFGEEEWLDPEDLNTRLIEQMPEEESL